MQRHRPGHLTIFVAASDYRVYVAAARMLARTLGSKAPDAPALIQHELKNRKSKAVAEEYLFFIGWYDPKPAGPDPKAKLASSTRTGGRCLPLRKLSGAQPPSDVGRN